MDENYFEKTHLEYLKMYNLNFRKIPAAIGKLEHLGHLKLSKGNLLHVDLEFQSLIRLTELDLSYNKIQTIPKLAFKSNKRIEYFNFNHNKIKIFYPETFHHCQNINVIEVTYNKLKNLQGLPLEITYVVS